MYRHHISIGKCPHNRINLIIKNPCTTRRDRAAFLSAVDVITFSENGEKLFAMVLLSCIMVFIGIVSPKLPYNRHTGLRLPWTVRDEDTWKIAHRILGFISFPMVLLYIACALTISDFEIVSVVTMLIWIGIPGGISYIYFYKKYHSNKK